MKLLTLTLVIFFSLITTSLATPQILDTVKYEGREYSIGKTLLEPYFEKHPDKRPYGGGGSALWRGYIATFSISNQMIQLEDIQIISENFERKSVIHDVMSDNKPLDIDWVTGILVLTNGKIYQPDYVYNMNNTDENYIIFEIKKGKVTEKREFDDFQQYEAFKERQFAQYKKTDDYKALSQGLNPEEWAQNDRLIQHYIMHHISEFMD